MERATFEPGLVLTRLGLRRGQRKIREARSNLEMLEWSGCTVNIIRLAIGSGA
jgi:hypothetical protein